MFDPFYRVVNLWVNEFDWIKFIQQAQQIFAPVFFGLVGFWLWRNVQRINQEFCQFLPFLWAECFCLIEYVCNSHRLYPHTLYAYYT